MQYYLILAAILFAIGFNKYVVSEALVGQMFAIFVIVIAAAEATVGLAIVLLIYRNWRGIGTDNYSVMKW